MNDPDLQILTAYLHHLSAQQLETVVLFGSWTYRGYLTHQMAGSRQEDDDEA